MNISLKNIKYSKFSSNETKCFIATVYIDNKASFYSKNDGFGGETYYFPINNKHNEEEITNIISKINLELNKEIDNLPNCLDFVIEDLIDDWLINKKIKQDLKNICYIRDEGLYIIRKKPTDENIKKMKQQKWWKNKYKILNNLPIEEIRKYFLQIDN